MSINLALILTVLTAITGAVVLLNKFVWKVGEKEEGGSVSLQTLVEYSQSFFPVLLFVLGRDKDQPAATATVMPLRDGAAAGVTLRFR